MDVDPPRPEADLADATRRTRLANERTYLAWWRTSLTAFAVSLGAGRLVPDLTGGERWPYVLDGAGFAVLAILLLVYGSHREREVSRALREGRFVEPDRRLLAIMTGLGVVLGLLTLALVIFAP
jgi:putative membrane protein